MRILIIEDEHLVAAVLQDHLDELGYSDVAVAPDLTTGHRLLETEKPDFAILDVNIAGAKVFPIAAALSAMKIPFIFATGEPRESLPPEWRDWPLLSKPALFSDLSTALEQYAPRTPPPG